MKTPTDCTYRIATPQSPGAIAIIDLYSNAIESQLTQLTGKKNWPIGFLRVSSLAGVDRGLAVRLNDQHAQLMPHGGLQVLQQITETLQSHDIQPANEINPLNEYPEAKNLDEALMLTALANAQSESAIDLLLQQPDRWKKYRESPDEPIDETRKRSIVLNRLLTPPVVILIGPPNTGKSTLTNTLVGRSASITNDEQGTTRDYVGVQLSLDGLSIWWFDTPGRNASHSSTEKTIESQAAALTDRLFESADLILSATDPTQPWPNESSFPHPPDKRILLKSDLKPNNTPTEADIEVSALENQSLDQLTQKIRNWLIPQETLNHTGPWLFDERLIQ